MTTPAGNRIEDLPNVLRDLGTSHLNLVGKTRDLGLLSRVFQAKKPEYDADGRDRICPLHPSISRTYNRSLPREEDIDFGPMLIVPGHPEEIGILIGIEAPQNNQMSSI